ncbi:MAG: acyltransferase [Oscillospiraceae bacterium]|nr:acyltransferase [Oscillospiraceae bacterium]
MEASPPQKKRSLYLDVARTVAIISISLNHAVNRTYRNYDGQQLEFLTIPLVDSVLKAIITIFSKIGVPLFLMISGALLMNKRMEGPSDVKRFYRHNLLDLLITAEIWYVIIYWCKLIIGADGISLADLSLSQAIAGMVETMLFLDQNTLDSMWYMPMILCLYTTLPFLVMAKDKLASSKWLLLIPGAVVLVYCMVMPAINGILWLGGQPTVDVTIREADLVSVFYLYLIAGYFIGSGALSRVKGWILLLTIVVSFALTCCYQLYAYSCPRDLIIGYEFPLLLICGGASFETIRRASHHLERLRRPITYISKISLGIYFMHILIMLALARVLGDAGRTTLWRLTILEVGSVGLSIVLIALLSQIKPLRKRLFLIK